MSDPNWQALVKAAGPVSRETYERLRRFETLFQKWSAVINLTAASTRDHFWARHVLDSAQLIPLAPKTARWLDLGSGGGFPGAVLAILLADQQGSIDLVESNRKKASFLQSVLGEIGAPAQVWCLRIEDAPSAVGQPDLVTARALAPLPHLLELAAPWLCAGATGLFHKGRDYQREIEESLPAWAFDLVEHPSSVDSQGVVLEIRKLRRR